MTDTKEETGRKTYSIRLTLEARELLDLLAKHIGGSRAFVVELAIRNLARLKRIKN